MKTGGEGKYWSVPVPVYKEEERRQTGQCQFIKRRREERLISASLYRGGDRTDWSVPVY